MPLAGAIELIHTYSLIHDDLPAMDDDALRRGQPTCHVKFGEDVAILAGDGLYAEAFHHLLSERSAPPQRVLAAAAELAAATGVSGMVGGQYADVSPRTPNGPQALRRLHELKTGRLIGASVLCVLLLAGIEDGPATIEFRRFAAELGVLFQIVDDILDVTGTDDALGKPQGSDRAPRKAHICERVRDRAGQGAGGGVPQDRPPGARRGRRADGSGECDRRARADHRLHLHPHLMSKDKQEPQKPLLAGIDGPRDLHGLSDEQLAELAQEVREHIIDTVGEIGGHFGANLGTCELAVALHSVLESPKDKILWDVGHQAYPHKILTGRRDQLSTIRQYEGLAPFCSIGESPHDIMGAGHASTSIGYAVGIKEGMRQGAGEQGKVVAVIGDGAMTGGVAFEAIGQAGGLGTPIVVVLNDNGMSIAPNVGATVQILQPGQAEPQAVARARGRRGRADAPAGRDRRRARAARPAAEGVDQGVLGARPVVGGARLGVHGRGRRSRRARAARGAARGAGGRTPRRRARGDGQGQGVRAGRGRRAGGHGEVARGQAEVDPQRHRDTTGHGAGRLRTKRGSEARRAGAGGRAGGLQYTQVFGEALVRECERDERVVGITAAMNSGTGLNILQKALPDRYFDVGIAEQQAILFAAGLALQGVKPVAAIYSTFLQRAYDQIVHDVCLQKLNVVFALDRAGLVGDDGPTHHGAFDIAYLRCLPNIVLMAPRDEAMLVNMLHTALLYDDGPIALRYPRGEGTGAELPRRPRAIEIGTGEILRRASARARRRAGAWR